MIIKRQNTVSWLIMTILSLLMVACSLSDETDLGNYINRIKARPAKPIEPIPEFAPLPKFVYPEIDNRRSPFKPKVTGQKKDAYAPNTKRPKQPLESYPLDALKFVGILKQGTDVWALIGQPGGLVSRVKMGDYMGKNFGRIISIKEKVITLEETVQIGGKWEKKPIAINLRTPD